MRVSKPGLMDPVAQGHRKHLEQICRTLQEAGYEVFIVGGCVRDLLLGKIPDEFDLTTNARPETVAGLFKKVIPTGIEHGTVTVLLDREPYEVTTYRSETTYSDGRRPDSIQYEDTLAADVARRDFTINGLAYDLLTEEVHDYCEGLADLERGLIKAIGDPVERFTEDGLRSVRACRFVVKLGFEIETATWDAIKPTLPVSEKVAVERFYDEWGKAMGYDGWPEFFELLFKSELLPIFMPAAVVADLLTPFSSIKVADHSWPGLPPEVWVHFSIKDLLGALELDPSDPDSSVVAKQALEACSYAAVFAGLLPGDSTGSGTPDLLKLTAWQKAGSNKSAGRFFTQMKRPHLARDLYFGLRGWLEFSAGYDWDESKVPGGYYGRLLSYYMASAPGNGYLPKLQPYFTSVLESAGLSLPAAIEPAPEPMTLKELAVSGADIMKEFAVKGPAVGLALQKALATVLWDPAKNHKKVLIEMLATERQSWAG